MKLFACLTAVAALTTAAPALAQDAAASASPQAPAAAAPQAAGAPSEEEVNKFGKLLVQVKELEKQGKSSDTTALLAAVESVGLTVEAYNAISTGMRTDTALNDRVQAAFQREAIAAREAANPAAATATAEPAPPAGG